MRPAFRLDWVTGLRGSMVVLSATRTAADRFLYEEFYRSGLHCIWRCDRNAEKQFRR